MKRNCTEKRKNLKGDIYWAAPYTSVCSQRNANKSSSPYTATLHWVKFGGGNSNCRTNQDISCGVHLLEKSRVISGMISHGWVILTKFVLKTLADISLEQLGLPSCVSSTYWCHIVMSRETILAFTKEKMGMKLVHLHSTSKFVLLFRSQNAAVWQQTDQSNSPFVLTSWKILSLAAGRNQQLPDHFIAFEII